MVRGRRHDRAPRKNMRGAGVCCQVLVRCLILTLTPCLRQVFSCDLSVAGPNVFKLLHNSDWRTALPIHEAASGMARPRLQDYLLGTRCKVLKGLARETPARLRKAFRKFDYDKSGELTLGGWMAYLASIKMARVDFYRKAFLLKDKCYRGLGMEPGTRLSCWYSCCCFTRGYWDDFAYYAANNHPLLILFFEDPQHP